MSAQWIRFSLVLLLTALVPHSASAQSYNAITGWRVAPWYPITPTRQQACIVFDAIAAENFQYVASGAVHGCPPYFAGGEGPGAGQLLVDNCHAAAVGATCWVFDAGRHCPYGGSHVGDACINPPACPVGQQHDPLTGICSTTKPGKNIGAPVDCNNAVKNPCNAATGTKFQVEPLLGSGNVVPLREQLSYNSRLLADEFELLVDDSAFGRGWRGNYERSLKLFSLMTIATRPDGRKIDFRPPASGNVFTADADIADRLERLVDGGGATTGWKYFSAADDSTETYSATGRLLTIADRAGVTLTITYSDSSTPPSVAPAAGLVIGVSDPFGRAISYFYNADKRVVRITDPAGGEYEFAYEAIAGNPDASGNLLSIEFPDGRQRQYRYNEQEHTQGTTLRFSLTGILDENGARFATYKYDPQGRVVSTEHAGGADKATLDYTAPGTTAVTDEHGVTRNYGLATLHGVVRGTGVSGAACPSCGPAAKTHDANGNVASRTDWNGNRTNYTYDLARNLEISRTEALTSGGSTTPQTRTITTQWHAAFRLPTGITEPLRITTNSYDADGTTCGARGALCSRSVQATTDASGAQGFSASASGSPRVWTYTYNANGSVLTVNGPRTDVADTTTYTYYANDHADPAKRANVATIANAAGHLTQITQYNAHGQPLAIIDPNGLTTYLVYDGRQRLVSRSVGTEVTSYDYDNAGQLTRVTLPDGSFLEYTYDDAHRLTAIQDNLGNRIAYTLDLAGNRTLEQVRDPSNALAQTRSREYNNLNRLFKELGAQNQKTEYTYDDQGNVLTVKDPLDKVTANQYDPLNRLKQVTDPGQGVTQYGYNGLDALTSVSDPRSLVTGYTVNGLGNLTQQVSPDTGTTANTYDAAGNLLTQTDAKSQVTTYAYDALNRVTLITFHDGSKQQYVYDGGSNGIGRLTSITERDPADQQTNKTSYTYDQHGRVLTVVTEHGGQTYTITHGYDGAGRLTTFGYPTGKTVTYDFDVLGRVKQAYVHHGGQSYVMFRDVAYHPFGGVKSYALGNGQAYTRAIDLDGRIASYTLGAQSFAVGYDLASRISFISDIAVPANSNTYGYDAVDRLTSAVTPGTPYAYTYDAVGNRTSKGSETYTYSATSNRIATVGSRSFAFDSNGSTTNDGNNTYAYDVRGRMVQATSTLGSTGYKVNALGQRIRKTNTLGDTVFHYDSGGRLIAETSPAGALKREYFYLGDIPVAVVGQ